MKLIIGSISCGILGIIVSSSLLRMGGTNVSDGGIILIGAICFFSPGLYILNKLYEKSKK